MARKRSSDDLSERFHELRGKYRKLQKENKILRRELERWAGWIDNFPEDEEDAVVPERHRNPKCPKCKSEINIIPAGAFEIKVCTSCSWRHRKEIT